MRFILLCAVVCASHPPGATANDETWGNLKQYDHIRGDGAHDTLWHQLFGGGSPDHPTDGIAWEKISQMDVPRWHFDYYDKDKNGELSYKEFLRFSRERFQVYRRTKADLFDGPDPKGHLQNLGSHRAPDPDFDIIEDGNIHPRDFWKKYQDGHRPAMLRGVERNSAGVKKWTVDYLVENYGDKVDLKIEPKKESRGDSSVLNHIPKRLSIREFMKRRVTDNIYAVSVMPQNMAWEVNVPAAILCGGRERTRDRHQPQTLTPHPFPHPNGNNWLTHIYEANLWLADGRTRSQVHYDKEHNLNCLYQGEKRWVLIDTRKHFDDMAWVRGGRYKSTNDLENSGTDWVPIDPDAVDLRVNREFQNVTYYEVTQYAGDCIFLPFSMVHWVNKTNPGIQVAMSLMWLPSEKYDEKACAKAPLTYPDSGVPLAAFDILWYFSGKGVIPQGYPDPDFELLRNVQRIMHDQGAKHFTLEVLQHWLEGGDSPLKSDSAMQIQMMRNFSSYAAAPALGLTMHEMRWPTVPLEQWLMLATEGDPEGMLPCDIGEHYECRSPEEIKRSYAHLDGLEAQALASRGAKAGARGQEL